MTTKTDTGWVVKRRLALSTAGALTAHAFFFGAGYWGIQQIQIPAKEDRALVLTLQSTPLDSVKESVEEPEATLNDAALSKKAQSAKSDSSTIVDDTTTIRTNTSDSDLKNEQEAATQTASYNSREQAADPIPDVAHTPQAERTRHINTTQASAATEQVTAELTQESLSLDSESPVTQSNIQTSHAIDTPTTTKALPLLVSADSALTVPTVGNVRQVKSTPKNDTVKESNNSPLSSAQQSKLERKLTSWAQRLKDDTAIPESMNWQAQGQSYTVNIQQRPADNQMETDELLVEVLTEKNGQQFSTTMRMKKLAFSHFAQFVHRWDPGVMMHNDELDGRFHSNSTINVDYTKGISPTFHSKVTTASQRIGIGSRSARKKIFRGGLETGVKSIRMPKPRPLFAQPPGDENSNTIFFEQNTRIVFTASGHYMWHAADQHGPMQRAELDTQALYIIGAPGKTLYVSGSVNGQVLIYSPRRIVIEGNLVYANHTDARTFDHDNLLGLVSGRNIEIAGNKVTPPGDLEIHAAIYAKQRFAVRNYRAKHTGTLIIHGSLTAGSISATEPRYATKITFDKRLEKRRPPGFPVTNRYEIAATEHPWRSVQESQETPYLLDEDFNSLQ